MIEFQSALHPDSAAPIHLQFCFPTTIRNLPTADADTLLTSQEASRNKQAGLLMIARQSVSNLHSGVDQAAVVPADLNPTSCLQGQRRLI